MSEIPAPASFAADRQVMSFEDGRLPGLDDDLRFLQRDASPHAPLDASWLADRLRALEAFSAA
jgi:hypothetical protein